MDSTRDHASRNGGQLLLVGKSWFSYQAHAHATELRGGHGSLLSVALFTTSHSIFPIRNKWIEANE
jgi:hypothetical protein